MSSNSSKPDQSNTPPRADSGQDRVKIAQAEKERAEDLLDHAVEETFPASDPISPDAAARHAERAERVLKEGAAAAKPISSTKPDKPLQ